MIGRRSFLDNADAEETFVIRILQKLVGQRMLDMRRAIEQQQDASSGIFLTAGASFFSESDWNELLSLDFDRGRLFPASPYPAPDRRTCEDIVRDMLRVHNPADFVNLIARGRQRVDNPAAPRGFKLTVLERSPDCAPSESSASVPPPAEPAVGTNAQETDDTACEPSPCVLEVSLTQTLASGRRQVHYAEFSYGTALDPGSVHTLKLIMAHLHVCVVKPEIASWPRSILGGWSGLPQLAVEHYARSVLLQVITPLGTGLMNAPVLHSQMAIDDTRDLLGPFKAAEQILSLSQTGQAEAFAGAREVGAQLYAAINGRNQNLGKRLYLLAVAPPEKAFKCLLDKSVMADTASRLRDRIEGFRPPTAARPEVLEGYPTRLAVG
jgi:hypothetical protein